MRSKCAGLAIRAFMARGYGELFAGERAWCSLSHQIAGARLGIKFIMYYVPSLALSC